MSRRALVRLVMLAGAVGCVLVGLRVLPAFAPPADLGRQPSLIVDDTGMMVVIARCSASCTVVSGLVHIAPGGTLRVGQASDAVFLVEDESGRRVGCLMTGPTSKRLLVSRAGPCPARAARSDG